MKHGAIGGSASWWSRLEFLFGRPLKKSKKSVELGFNALVGRLVSGQIFWLQSYKLNPRTPEAAGVRKDGDVGGCPELEDDGNSSPSLSSRNRRGGTGGFTLSLVFPP